MKPRLKSDNLATASFGALLGLGLLLVSSLSPAPALAENTLPYAVRTKGYSGYSSTVKGDIRTIGMAGATVGLADTWNASVSNPAGLAMTVDNFGAHLSGNRIRDGYLQEYSQEIQTSNLGAVGNPYPWGFSIGYWTPSDEGERYFEPTTGARIAPEILVREFKISAAHVFFDNKLSLGVSLNFGQAVEGLDFPDMPQLNKSNHSYKLGTSFGAIYKFPRRWLLGMSFTPDVTYDADPVQNPTLGIQGFFRPVKTPFRFALGAGWIPNHIFRMGISLNVFGTTSDVALLRDENLGVGVNPTVQPRIGFLYTLAEYKNFKAEATAGSYLEVSQIEHTPTRLHGTAGLEFNIWVFNLGWGVDESRKYENFIYSAGVDVFRIARKLDLVPPDTQTEFGGMFPSPRRLSDEGLPRPLADHWVDHHQKNPLEIAQELPERAKAKFEKVSEDIKKAMSGSDSKPAEVKPREKVIFPGQTPLLERGKNAKKKKKRVKKKEPAPRASPVPTG